MVFRLSKQKKPLPMCSEAKARYLLSTGKAVVHKTYPFTIRLKNHVTFKNETSYTLKIDPGSNETGLALVDRQNHVCFLAVIEHRAGHIKSLLQTRHGARRHRRQRETRYRKCKWVNHYLKKDSNYKAESPRPEGWLPPSVQSIVDNIDHWIARLSKWCVIDQIVLETVKFDTQLMDNPEINGVEYQQGELEGYEVREYLLEKYQHTCQYCQGESGDTVLEVEHKQPKSRGGSNALKNLSLACHTCNQNKDHLNLTQWLEVLKSQRQTKLTKKRIKCVSKVLSGQQVGGSTRYAAWVNSYRKKLIQVAYRHVEAVECGRGSQTKYNRIKKELPKEHYYDALCVGRVPALFKFKTNTVLTIKATGRGSHFRGATNECGVINRKLPRQKTFFGFKTGDMVKAVVTKGKKIGTYVGRVAVRSSGSFNITTPTGKVQGIGYRNCRIVQYGDGYGYEVSKRAM